MDKILDSIGKFFAGIFVSDSAEAGDINSLFGKFLIAAGIVAVMIAGLVIIAAIRFRAKRRPGMPSQYHGSNVLEIVWTGAALITVSYFFVLTIQTMRLINQPFQKGRRPDITITAHQWWWDMRYPEYHVITANELHIPVGAKLLTQIRSADVIHDWWVPSLGRKVDAVPGHINYTWIDAYKPGLYKGTCSEYCGMQHAWMRIRVIAETPEDFAAWIHHQQQIPSPPTDSLGLAGARLFQDNTCGNCHAIAGTQATAHIGPDLTHLASRQTILSGMLPNTLDNLKLWLTDPQKVKKGSHMPDFRLSEDKVNALANYLEGLK